MNFKPAPLYKFQFKPGDKVKFGKVEAEIVSVEEGENAAAIICLLAEPELLYPDNEVGVCSGCDRKVQHRPKLPVKPPRLCLDCATQLYGKGEMTM